MRRDPAAANGLDEAQEARRLACVGVISGYALAHGFVPLVVCPRAAEYRALRAVSRRR
jgi:hypothetical protein